MRTQPIAYSNDGYETIPSTDISSTHSESTESQLSYESQTRMAFFKGDLGGLVDTSSVEGDLDSVVVLDNVHAEGDEEEAIDCGAVVSRSQAMVRDHTSGSVVVENPHAAEEDRSETSPPDIEIIMESTSFVVEENPNAIEEGRDENSQAITRNSCVVVNNPNAVENGRDMAPPNSQVTTDGIIFDNPHAEMEGDDIALPTSEAAADEQGCVVLDNPHAEVEERDTTLIRRDHGPHTGNGNPSLR